MKNHFIPSFVILWIFAGCAQSPSSTTATTPSTEKKTDVPEVILNRFNALYTNTSKVDWELEKGKYEVTFLQNQKEFTVIFMPDGMVEQTETPVDPSSLPKGATDYITQNLGGKKIEEVTRIVDAVGIVTWEAEVDHEDYLFTQDGQLLGKQQPEEEDDEDD